MSATNEQKIARLTDTHTILESCSNLLLISDSILKSAKRTKIGSGDAGAGLMMLWAKTITESVGDIQGVTNNTLKDLRNADA